MPKLRAGNCQAGPFFRAYCALNKLRHITLYGHFTTRDGIVTGDHGLMTQDLTVSGQALYRRAISQSRVVKYT